MKTKNIILAFLVVLLFIAFLVWLVSASKQNSLTSTESKNSALEVKQNQYDFGEISMANGKVEYDFEIINKTQESTKIKKIYTSCMCTEAVVEIGDKKFGPFGMPGHGLIPSINQDIKTGDKFIVKAIFNPAAHGPAGLGRIERQIYIEEEGVKNPLTLTIRASVIP